ncbi:MAG: hypothetical protein ND895_20395 [Pyrinomonadaceae bacterium]|nr:hypothetical protein [Pyrinomonadaceae bacterium]
MSAAREEFKELSSFSLLGGPLHRLGCRAGLVRELLKYPLGELVQKFFTNLTGL